MERTNSTLTSGYYTAYHDGIVWPVLPSTCQKMIIIPMFRTLHHCLKVCITTINTQCHPLGEWRRSTWFLHGAMGQTWLKAFLRQASFSEEMQSQMSGQDLNGSWLDFGFSFGYPWPALTMHHVLNENYGMCLGPNTSVLLCVCVSVTAP